MQKLDYIIYIGRMQPPTKAHITNIKKALELARSVIILLGSCNQPRTVKNPWDFVERASMIKNDLHPSVHANLFFRPLTDFRYNDQEWIEQVQRQVKVVTGYNPTAKIGIIGYKKDDSSNYLNFFPQWKLIEVDKVEDVDATTVREQYFNGELFSWKDKDLISPNLTNYLKEWSRNSTYNDLKEEYVFINMYKKQWENSPYPPTFVTVDCVVIQSGHVLLVQRKENPGKNLWALPGGFLSQNERIKDAAIRELKEETKIKVPEAVLRGSIIGEKTFDLPSRSLRGRTITHAFVIQLDGTELYKVKGSDDAAKAKWIPLYDVLEMENQLFEDHSDIIKFGISICK